MNFNIFRNRIVDAQVGYLMDMMVDARRKETEDYWRETLESEFQERLDAEYRIGYIDGYNDATKAYFDDMHSFVEEQTTCKNPPDLLSEPVENLTDDLI